MLPVNDCTHSGTVGDPQHANNIYSLTPRREAAGFPRPAASGSVPFLVNKHMQPSHLITLYINCFHIYMCVCIKKIICMC